MNTSTLSDKVSLVNFSKSTPNSVLNIRDSYSAQEEANVLIISLTFKLYPLPSVSNFSVPSLFVSTPKCFFSPPPNNLLPSVVLIHVCETPNSLSSNTMVVSPWFFLNVPAYRKQVTANLPTLSVMIPFLSLTVKEAEREEILSLHFTIIKSFFESPKCTVQHLL